MMVSAFSKDVSDVFREVADYLEPVDPSLPKVNAMGDRRVIAHGGTCGPDISRQRVDDLDRACADHVYGLIQAGTCVSVLDIGCGIGAQSLRLAALGAKIVAVDLVNQGQQTLFDAYMTRPSPFRTSARFICDDVRLVLDVEEPSGSPYDVIYSQRMWSSIPYRAALGCLTRLNREGVCAPDAHFFISAIGLDSEIGEGYPHRTCPVEDRFAPYAPDMADKHGVTGSECLYTLNELVEQVEQAELTVVKSWTSTFGNPKLVAMRRLSPHI